LEAPEAEAAAPEAKPAPAPVAPTTGALEIRSGVSGADVFLNDKRVGTTPHKASGLAPGSYRVKVEKAGYAPFEQRVEVAAERRVVRAELVAALASLRVETNVPGARVLLDGEERGTTPLELSNLSPGRHQLEVSADGYETRTETVELESGKRDVKIDLASPLPAASNEAVAVKHKHRIGSCEGVLRANSEKFEYDSPHKDAFSVALSEVERFSVEEETLSLKVRDGRNYNFKVSSDDHAALASFFERVAPSLEEKN
ncbi:MAG: PEGA domain-containing protein, partial [Vicinamibacteria bacterium]